MKRQRGRSRNNNNKNNHNHNHSNRSLDSNGPDVKIRGSASTIYDKYVTMARDAMSSGNRVKAENLRQHAEHYLRVVNELEAAKKAAQAVRDEQQAKHNANNNNNNKPSNDDGDDNNSEKKPRRHQPRSRDDSSDKSEKTASDMATTSDGLEVVTPEGTKPKLKSKPKPKKVAAAPEADGAEKPKATRRRKAPTKPDVDEAASTAAE